MNTSLTLSHRPAQLLELAAVGQSRIARAQNFVVEWLESPHATQTVAASPHEMLLLLPDCAAEIVSHTRQGDKLCELAARSVAILPAGRHSIVLRGQGAAALIASRRDDLADNAIQNDAAYRPPDDRIAPYLPGFKRKSDEQGVVAIDIDKVVAPAGKSRLKMFQTETLSINWVEYEGSRDRTQLSPHSHADFEQGSLSMAGHYLHHLRTPWGSNANQWQEDRHLKAGPGSLLVVPVEMIHTTEGEKPGRHLLIDIFSPPRRDFIAQGWVHNAGDYRDGAGGS